MKRIDKVNECDQIFHHIADKCRFEIETSYRKDILDIHEITKKQIWNRIVVQVLWQINDESEFSLTSTSTTPMLGT